ncbi:MAG: glycosyltransferase [Candidatus Scalindua sp.]|nr:glycosyltransferase [Candidatus Scalindua sp.]
MHKFQENSIELPLVSIITPSLNQAIFLEKTILSVLSQDYPAVEHIIIDGGSNDNTLAILRKYENRIKWISGPDHGQADAVNKGITMVKGDIIGWLNSDDTYNQSAISTAVKHFMENHEMIMIYGDAFFINTDGKSIGKYPTEEFKLERLADTCFICQPTVFLKRQIFNDIGVLDTNLHTCMDYEYWIRIGKYYPKNRIAYIKGTYLANSRMYHENKTSKNRENVYKEAMKTQKKYFGKVSKIWILFFIKEIIFGISFKIK